MENKLALLGIDKGEGGGSSGGDGGGDGGGDVDDNEDVSEMEEDEVDGVRLQLVSFLRKYLKTKERDVINNY